jgi:hypothetical protein
MPPLVQKRIKEALYEMENGIITFIQDNGIYDKSKQN